MKILVHSNAPWVPSGYGEQCRLLIERLKPDHDVAVSAFCGLEGSTLKWNDIIIYPKGAVQFGSDVIARHAKHHFDGQRGIILTLLDVWVLRHGDLKDQPLASWVPIDHQPLLPIVYEYFDNTGAIPIAMSKFGQQQLQNADLDALYVPHGIDTEIFKPLDQDECRDKFGIAKDAFVVGMVAANQGSPSRKAFPEAFMAMAQFMKDRHDVYFFLHTDTSGLRGQGVDLVTLAAQCGIDSKRVIECDQYKAATGLYGPGHMAQVYSSIDVLLNPSLGEGFGIPIIEAQACGTPVIGTDFSAMQEVVSAGWLVSGQKFYTGLGSWQVIPNIGEIVDCLKDAYVRADQFEDQARMFSMQYDADEVFANYWVDTISEVYERSRARQIMELMPI